MELGIAAAIGLAVLIVIYESAFPQVALLGQVGTYPVYRCARAVFLFWGGRQGWERGGERLGSQPACLPRLGARAAAAPPLVLPLCFSLDYTVILP